MGRNRMPDGSFRGLHQPTEMSARKIRGMWVQQEVLRLKSLGLSTFQAIAEQISKVGRGEAPPMSKFPPGIAFPKDYSISAVACWKALRKALTLGPKLRADEMREIDTVRLEEGILAAQKGIRQGNPQSLRSLHLLITTKARINGYMEPQKVELSGRSGGPVEIRTSDETEISQMLERLSQDEQVEFMRLYRKALGNEANKHMTGEEEEKINDGEENQTESDHSESGKAFR